MGDQRRRPEHAGAPRIVAGLSGHNAAMTTQPRCNEFGQPIGEPLVYGGAQPPAPVTLTGRSCELVPLRVAHAPELLESLQALGGDEQWTYMPYGPCRDAAECAEVVAELVGDPSTVTFGIRAGGRIAGMASLMRIAPAGGTIEVGSIMYGAGVRRAMPATEAMYLLARHVFEDLGYRRYEWKCDALNAPSRAAALRLGFVFEGVWRNATFYKGRNRDTAWFAITDADWGRLRVGYERWLAQDCGAQAAPLRDYLAEASSAARDSPAPD